MEQARPRNYVGTFVALIALTATTVGLAYVDLGPLHAFTGLTIAAAKCVLILLFFMHLLQGYRLNRVMALSGLLWLGILIGLSLTDFLTRNWPMSDVGGLGQ